VIGVAASIAVAEAGSETEAAVVSGVAVVVEATVVVIRGSAAVLNCFGLSLDEAS